MQGLSEEGLLTSWKTGVPLKTLNKLQWKLDFPLLSLAYRVNDNLKKMVGKLANWVVSDEILIPLGFVGFCLSKETMHLPTSRNWCNSDAVESPFFAACWQQSTHYNETKVFGQKSGRSIRKFLFTKQVNLITFSRQIYHTFRLIHLGSLKSGKRPIISSYKNHNEPATLEGQVRQVFCFFSQEQKFGQLLSDFTMWRGIYWRHYRDYPLHPGYTSCPALQKLIQYVWTSTFR